MNALAPLSAIVSRLEESTGYRVYTSRDVDTGKRMAQRAPCLFVAYGGYSVDDEMPMSQSITQLWIVLVAVENERNNQGGDNATETAGKMVYAVMKALGGFVVSGDDLPDFTPLRLVNQPGSVGYDDKFFYYPVGFETKMRIRNEC